MLKDKVVLITGGTGSIGRELVRQVLAQNPAQLRVFSRDESKQHQLLHDLGNPKNLRLFIGDIRDKERLSFAFQNVDIVFHAAALKHVTSCEYNPFEAIATNVVGSQNIINAALKNGVDKVVAISTDKVVDPAGVMGTTKLLMEKLMINANYYRGDAETKFSCVRFGNVAWARGSVLPLWKTQAEEKGSIAITNGAMTRFIMSIPDAAQLVIEASELMYGGEVFILKMPAISLRNLAEEFLAKYFPGKKVKITVIGSRPGEKMHEGLLGSGDGKVLENKRMFISIPNVWVYTGDATAASMKRMYHGFKKHARKSEYVSDRHLNAGAVRRVI